MSGGSCDIDGLSGYVCREGFLLAKLSDTIDDLIDLLVGHLRKHRQAQDAFDDVLGSR